MTNGYGRMIYESGDLYEGEWKNNKSHGFGTYITVKENNTRDSGTMIYKKVKEKK